jgi:hypothetical protein
MNLPPYIKLIKIKLNILFFDKSWYTFNGLTGKE